MGMSAPEAPKPIKAAEPLPEVEGVKFKSGAGNTVNDNTRTNVKKRLEIPKNGNTLGGISLGKIE